MKSSTKLVMPMITIHAVATFFKAACIIVATAINFFPHFLFMTMYMHALIRFSPLGFIYSYLMLVKLSQSVLTTSSWSINLFM